MASRLKEIVRFYGGRVGELVRYVGKAREHRAVPAQFADILAHRIRLGTNWRDYYRLEFYKAGKSWEEKTRYVGKGGSRYYPYQNNPIAYVYLFGNKLVTKTMLAGFGFPQPELLATIGRDYEIKNRDQLQSFLGRADRDLVIKPIDGSGGQGVLVLTRHDAEWRMGGQPCSADDVWERVSRTMRKGLLIEERVRNNAQAAALYPHSLNTLRVVTIKTVDGRWHAAHVGMRLGKGGKSVDNLAEGGILLWIDRDGCTSQAYDFGEDRAVTHHPDTGVPLTGIALDGYRGAVDLGLRAAEKFGFMGIIGWDIALTESGPLIVEGNSNPDAHYWQVGSAGPWITGEMAHGLKQRGPFARWDKTKIHPKFNQHRIQA